MMHRKPLFEQIGEVISPFAKYGELNQYRQNTFFGLFL